MIKTDNNSNFYVYWKHCTEYENRTKQQLVTQREQKRESSDTGCCVLLSQRSERRSKITLLGNAIFLNVTFWNVSYFKCCYYLYLFLCYGKKRQEVFYLIFGCVLNIFKLFCFVFTLTIETVFLKAASSLCCNHNIWQHWFNVLDKNACVCNVFVANTLW